MSETIYGRHPVQEVLRARQRAIHRVLIATDSTRAGQTRQLATEAGVPVEQVEAEQLDRGSDHHQGLAVVVGPYRYAELGDILDHCAEPDTLVLILDQVQDPQNLGTVLRTADAVGVSGVIVPTRAAAGVTPAVVSASAGACEHLRIARTNLAQAIRQLKQAGVWIAGLEASPEAERIDKVDLKPPLAIVVGSEGYGLRRLVRESCDFLVRIPMRGSVSSLNAAVAGSLALHEAWRRSGYAGDRQPIAGAEAAAESGSGAGRSASD